MNPTTGKVLGATLAGTILLAGLATLSVTTTDSVTSSEPAGGSFSVSQTVAGTQKPAPAQPTPSANQTYTVVPTGSFSIQGSKTSAIDSAISKGSFGTHTQGKFTGLVANVNGDQLVADTVGITPSSLYGDFYLIPKSGGPVSYTHLTLPTSDLV